MKRKTKHIISIVSALSVIFGLTVIPQTVSAVKEYREELIYEEDFTDFTENVDYVNAGYDTAKEEDAVTPGTWYIGAGGRVMSHNLAYGAFAKGGWLKRTHVPYMFPDSFDNTQSEYEVSFKYKNHSGTSRIYLLSSEGDMIDLSITSWGTASTYYRVTLAIDGTSCKVYRSDYETALKNISISGKKIVGMILFLYASSSGETTSYAWIDDVIVKQGDTVIASENFDDWQRADIDAQTEAEIAYKGAENVLHDTTPSLYARPDGEDKCLATQWHTKGAGTGEWITFVFPEVMTSGKYKITYDYLAAGNWCDYLYLYTSSGSSQINFPWDSNQQSVWREMVVNVDVDAGIWTAANRSGSASIDGTVDRMVLRMHQNAENGVEMLIDNVKIYKIVSYSENEIYNTANGWTLLEGGMEAQECEDGSLKLGKGVSNAAIFKPELEYGKAYEITYDVSGLAVESGSWKKPITVALTAGGQTESNVLTYRLGGAWRDSETDQCYSSGSNGTNRIVIDTVSGEWETYALGNKATYSGLTSEANNKVKTYNAFADVSDFSIKLYAYDRTDDFEPAHISNVKVTELEPVEYEDDEHPELVSYKIKSNGTVVETPEGLSDFSIELDFRTDARTKGDVTAWAAVYDNGGKLVSAGKTDETIKWSNASLSVDMSLSEPYSKDNTFKAFVWDGNGSLKPLIPVIYPTESFTLYPVHDGVELHNDMMLAYLDDSYENVDKYAWGSFDKDDPRPVGFEWASNTDASGYTLEISENSDMSDARVITTDTNSCEVYNLKVGTKYYWRVSVGGNESEISSFTTTDRTPRCIQALGLSNGRDIGGWNTVDGGRVKQGMIYRSYCFDYVSNGNTITLLKPEGIDTLVNGLGIKSEVDLRSESSKTSSILGESVNYYRFGFNYDGDYLASNKTSIKNVFDTLADASNYPIIWHCQAGADRTGAVTYLLNGLLGVSKEDLLRDYLLTNFAINDNSSRSISSISSRYVKTLDEYNNGEGTLAERIYAYLNNEIGVSTENLNLIKSYMLED